MREVGVYGVDAAVEVAVVVLNHIELEHDNQVSCDAHYDLSRGGGKYGNNDTSLKIK